MCYMNTKSSANILNAVSIMVSVLMPIGPLSGNNGAVAKSVSADISAEQNPMMTYKASTSYVYNTLTICKKTHRYHTIVLQYVYL